MFNDPIGVELERIQKHVSFCSTRCCENSYVDFILYPFNGKGYIILFVGTEIGNEI